MENFIVDVNFFSYSMNYLYLFQVCFYFTK